MKHKFPYTWRLADGYPAKGIEHHGCKVFGTFICGGGSSMGYKLAGFDHLGGVELDPKVSQTYKQNHHPKYLYNMDIRQFNELQDLPAELYNLDILDGSPPCSTFSMAGQREKAWGKEKQFSEGQKKQTLDDLVFVYAETINKLQPKTFILENVSGLVKGNAKAYVARVLKQLDAYGYISQVFLLNAAKMGVPQARERTFIIGHRKDLHLPKLVLNFNEPPILFGEIVDRTATKCNLSAYQKQLWDKRIRTDRSFGDIIERTEHRLSMFSNPIYHSDRVANCLTSSAGVCSLYDIPRNLTEQEICKIGTFPLDYNFTDGRTAQWYVGMSVAPVMMAQVSHQIYLQWLSKIH